MASSEEKPPAVRQSIDRVLAVVLAAGEGTRLRPFTADLPKAMLSVGGVTLLERQLDSLASVGVHHVAVVAGHGWRSIETLLDDGRRSGRWDLAIELIVNSDFRSTGTAGSLLLGLGHSACVDAQGVLVVEGDVLLHPGALRRLLDRDDDHDVQVLAASTPLESSLIRADATGTVRRIVHRSDLTGAPAGPDGRADFYNLSCYRFAGSSMELVRLLDQALSVAPRINVERVIDSLCDTGRIGLALVDPEWAIEIDTPEDLKVAQRYVEFGEW